MSCDLNIYISIRDVGSRQIVPKLVASERQTVGKLIRFYVYKDKTSIKFSRSVLYEHDTHTN